MTAIVSSIGLKGLEGYRIQVEVQKKFGLESIKIIRLARTLSDLQQNNKISDLNI